MSQPYHATRQTAPRASGPQAGDVLVLFGELFQRGYATGLVEYAESRGLHIIESTVGRRDKEGLRPLNSEELTLKAHPTINVPLEAGFDFEKSSAGLTPVEQCKDIGLKDWEQAKLDFTAITESKLSGQARFRAATQSFLQALDQSLPTGCKKIVLAHLMAGGVPRAKIILPLMNRVVKGKGDRFLSSELFWQSDLGKLCATSFFEVTANTLNILIEELLPWQQLWKKRGIEIAVTAYGYHGTEVYFDGALRWQSYSPYLQGWAKLALEEAASAARNKGVQTTVFNCPEILTNSSSIFQGVELPLYPLMGLFHRTAPQHPRVVEILQQCQSKLKPDCTIEQITHQCEQALGSLPLRDFSQFATWPQHNSREQLESMLRWSEQIFEMHNSDKDLITNVLSEVVFAGCGEAMLNECFETNIPVTWLNHDLITNVAIQSHR